MLFVNGFLFIFSIEMIFILFYPVYIKIYDGNKKANWWCKYEKILI